MTEKVKLPVLKLGKSEDLYETMELYGFGFPFGKMLAFDKGEFPAMSVNTGKVSSLRKKDGKLESVQIDVVLNPGNSGGPLLDSTGRVAAIVVSGIPRRGINFAIPADKARAFLATPILTFTPPKVTTTTVFHPITLEATVDDLLPDTQGDITLQIALQPAGQPQTVHPMKLIDGKYQVETTLIKKKKGPQPQSAVVEYEDGELKCRIEPIHFELDDHKKVTLAEISAFTGGPKPTLTLRKGGTKLEIAPRAQVRLLVGPNRLEIDLAKIKTIRLSPPPAWPPITITYEITAKRGDKEVTKTKGSLWVCGATITKNFLVCHGDRSVLMFDNTGKKLWEFKGCKNPWDARALPDGNILVSSHATNELIILSEKGKVVRRLKGDLKGPVATVLLKNGNILIAEYEGHALSEMSPDGTVKQRYFERQLQFPICLRQTRDGNILLAESKKKRVSIWSLSEKKMIWSKEGLDVANGAAELGNGYIAIAEENKKRVRVFDRKGPQKWTVNMNGVMANIGVTHEGNAIIAVGQKKNGSNILVLPIYSPEGMKLREIPLDSAPFRVVAIRPYGVIRNESVRPNFLITERKSNLVAKYSAEGKLLWEAGITLRPSGRVAVLPK